MEKPELVASVNLDLHGDHSAFYLALFEHSEDAIMVSQLGGRILDCNPAALRFFRAPSREAFLATPATAFYPDPEERTRYMQIFKEKGALHNELVRFMTCDREIRWALATGKVLRFPGGEERLITWLRDVTERVRIEEELRLHGEVFRHISEAIYLVQLDGRIVMTTPHFDEMYGYEEGELIGKMDRILLSTPGQDPDEKYREIQQCLEKSGFWEGDLHHQRKDGTIFLSHGRITLFDHSRYGRVAVHVHTDITASRQTERTIRKQNEELKTLASDKDRLLSVLAHDLRGSFQMITGYTDLLVSRPEPAMLSEYLPRISRAAWQANQLFDDLLLWARSGHLTFHPMEISLRRLCTEALGVAHVEAEAKGIRLEFPAGEDVSMKADRRMLQVILRNLLANAVKFTGKGGEVRLQLERQGPRARILVEDTGVGISKDRLATLDATGFLTATPGTSQETGKGIGLMLCREFVARHGGAMTFQSELGKGTRIEVTLPFSALS